MGISAFGKHEKTVRGEDPRETTPTRVEVLSQKLQWPGEGNEKLRFTPREKRQRRMESTEY